MSTEPDTTPTPPSLFDIERRLNGVAEDLRALHKHLHGDSPLPQGLVGRYEFIADSCASFSLQLALDDMDHNPAFR